VREDGGGEEPMNKCIVCGCKDGHHVPTNGTIGHEPLFAEDWKELLEYINKKEREQLKFVHELIARARKRQKGEL